MTINTPVLGQNVQQECIIESWWTLKQRFGTRTRRQTVNRLVEKGTVLYSFDGLMMIEWK
jgi:hypothetical protein